MTWQHQKVVISFCIIVSCTFISLLLVTVDVIYSYSRMGSSISVIVNILLDGENILFEARLVMYINSTSTITIMNRIYENQNLLYIVPLIRHSIVVCINRL